MLGVWREQEAALDSLTGCPPPCAISFPISIPLTSEAGVSLESDKLVNYEMSV